MSQPDRIDPDIVHRIVIKEGQMENPYSEEGKLINKLNSTKSYLISVAQEGRYTTYRETADEAGVFTARQSQVLGVLGLHEDEIGNPPLSAVVVQSREPPMVGEKYFNMVEQAQNLTDEIPATSSDRKELWQRHFQEVKDYWQ